MRIEETRGKEEGKLKEHRDEKMKKGKLEEEKRKERRNVRKGRGGNLIKVGKIDN